MDKEEELKQQKEVAWYSCLLEAWLTTRMELDKSILTLSSGAVGLLITLLVAFDLGSFCEAIFYTLSFIFFLTAIVSILVIFGRNAPYLERLLRKNDLPSDQPLKILDIIAPLAFGLGIVFSILVAVASVQRKKSISVVEVTHMSNEEKQEKAIDGGIKKQGSLNNLSEMRPNTKSLNNISNMRPSDEGKKPVANPPPASPPKPESTPKEDK